jgi:hypothetical protein|tara:strand:- start:1266 stop:1598 length:333 start_codon:yes stop_codon:yes gene_type:complete
MYSHLESLWESSQESKIGIRTKEACFFMGYKIQKKDDDTIVLSSLSEIKRNRKLQDEEIDVLLEKGWVEGVKTLYLEKYTNLYNNSDSENVRRLAKSKLNKYYERFSKIK